MNLKSIISILQNSQTGSSFEETQREGIKQIEEKNYYLEKEIENLKQRWEIFKYVNNKFDLFKEQIDKEQIDQVREDFNKDIKNIRTIKVLLFNKKDE